MDNNLKEWLFQRIAQEPEFIMTVVDALERAEEKAHGESHQAFRIGSIESIKYAQGRLDGIHSVIGILSGLKMSNTKQPAERGLIARMLGGGQI